MKNCVLKYFMYFLAGTTYLLFCFLGRKLRKTIKQNKQYSLFSSKYTKYTNTQELVSNYFLSKMHCLISSF
jgi:hypothetical protein